MPVKHRSLTAEAQSFSQGPAPHTCPSLHWPQSSRKRSWEISSSLGMCGLRPLAVEGQDNSHQCIDRAASTGRAEWKGGVTELRRVLLGARWLPRRGVNQPLLPLCQGEGEGPGWGVITVPAPHRSRRKEQEDKLACLCPLQLSVPGCHSGHVLHARRISPVHPLAGYWVLVLL